MLIIANPRRLQKAGLRAVVPLALLSLAAACSETTTGDPDSAPPIDPSAIVATTALEVLPMSDTLEYASFLKLRADAVPNPGEALVARIAPSGSGRSLVVSHGDTTTQVKTDGAGRVTDEETIMNPATDLVRHLPGANETIAIGHPFESGRPSLGYITSNHAKGSLTLDQHTVNTPVATWKSGDTIFVRLETRGHARIYALPDDYDGGWPAYEVLQHADVGPTFVGIADIAYLPGAGWSVQRVTRFADLEGEFDPDTITVSEARALPHSSFTFCLTKSTTAVIQAFDAVNDSLPKVPEFERCR